MADPATLSPVLQASLQGQCPRCGARTLFAGWIRFSDKCRKCGLDYRQFNVGDGPAAFLILIIGALMTALALVTQVKLEPPFWVHILLWVPLTTLAVIVSLRGAKAALLILEYRNKAREGTLVPPVPTNVDGPLP